MYIMSINPSKDLVFSRENGKIMAGGYKINSKLLEGERSLCGISREGGGLGASGGVGSILNGLAVPFGLLVAQQELGKKINTKKISTNEVVDGGLYDKLIDLAKMTNKRAPKNIVDRATVDRGTVERKEKKINKTKKNKKAKKIDKVSKKSKTKKSR